MSYLTRLSIILAGIALLILSVHDSSGPYQSDELPTRVVTREMVPRDGDILFVRGTSCRSKLVLLFNLNCHGFSHVGLVHMLNGAAHIVHAFPGDKRDDKGSVRIDTLTNFFASGDFAAAALYRVTPSWYETAKKASAIAEKFADAEVPFDHDFDLQSPEKLYCTELVWVCYKNAGLDLLADRRSKKRFILPSNIIESSSIAEVQRFAIATNPSSNLADRTSTAADGETPLLSVAAVEN